MESDQTPSYKVVLVGNEGVGKSALSQRMETNTFHASSSLGTGIKSLMLPPDPIPEDPETPYRDTAVELKIWDSFGLESIVDTAEAVIPLWFNGADVILLCYSLRDKSTLDALTPWLKSVRQARTANGKVGKPPAIILVGTQLDVVESFPEARKVSAEQAVRVAEQMSVSNDAAHIADVLIQAAIGEEVKLKATNPIRRIPVFETSSATGEGVTELVDGICYTALERDGRGVHGLTNMFETVPHPLPSRTLHSQMSACGGGVGGSKPKALPPSQKPDHENKCTVM